MVVSRCQRPSKFIVAIKPTHISIGIAFQFYSVNTTGIANVAPNLRGQSSVIFMH